MAPDRDPLQETAVQACAGRPAALYAFLQRKGALPGTRPNLRLAAHASEVLLSLGVQGRSTIEAMSKLSPAQAAPETAAEFLVVVGVVGTGIAAARERPDRAAAILSGLQALTEDPRPHVRDAVVHALAGALTAHGDAVLPGLKRWTDGYLQGAAVLEALARDEVLQKVRTPGLLVERFQECFELLERAPRSHERTQGYRALMRELKRAPAAAGRRFPTEVASWLEQAAATANPELREAVDDSLAGMRAAGVRAVDVQGAERALDASKKPPRDPRDDVGPTRGRGRKARRRGVG